MPKEMTAARKAKIYLNVLEMHENKKMKFREMAPVLKLTFQRCQQLYNEACEWREKNNV